MPQKTNSNLIAFVSVTKLLASNLAFQQIFLIKVMFFILFPFIKY